ncbi:MAG: hypothetical protein IKW95_00640 [Lachnospiraceae bacterium]|nr:hypothetical protein [Lachnospiraceae bacterium]
MKLMERKNLILFGLALLMLLIPVTNATPARAEEQDGESRQGEELVIDLRNGYAVFPDEGWCYNAKICAAVRSCVKLCDESPYSWNIFTADIDGDGTPDIQTDGYGWPDEEYPMPYEWFIIPTTECSVRGTVSLSVGKIDIETYRKYDTVTFIFPEEAFKNEYVITVEKGHAETYDGKVITSAAPGDVVVLVPDALDGEYVAYWTSTLVGKFSRYDGYSLSWMNATSFSMPASDVTMKATTAKQTPMIFDMTGGVCVVDEEYSQSPNLSDIKIPATAVEYSENLRTDAVRTERIDLDGDGSMDISCFIVDSSEYGAIKDAGLPHHVYYIPLPTSSIKGKYTYYEGKSSPYWPYEFVFPQKPAEKLYPITVEGGHAEDIQGRTITEAAPGERIRIVYDGVQGEIAGFTASPSYENLYRKWTSTPQLRKEVDMPACALSYKALPNEGTKLSLHFFSANTGRFSANLSQSVTNALKKDSGALEKVLCMYAGIPVQMGDRMLIMDYNSNYEYYSLEYTLPEPFITDDEIYTTVEVKFGDTYQLYPINCTDEAIVVYWMQSSQCNARILASAAGQLLYVNKVNLAEPEGYMFSGFEAKDFWMGYDVYWRLTMPSHEIELKPVFTKVDVDSQTPLVIDISDGSYRIMDHEILASIDRAGVPYDYTYYMYDLNGDGAWDVHLIQGQNMLQRLTDYSCGEYFTIETGNHGQKYFPITFVNKPKADTGTGVTPTVTPAKNDEKPSKNEATPTGAPAAANNKSKSKKGGALLVVLAILAMILVFGGVVGFNILKNRKEEEQRELRREKIAALRRQRAMEAEEYEEPSYEQTAEQPKEQEEPSDEEEEDEDYL